MILENYKKNGEIILNVRNNVKYLKKIYMIIVLKMKEYIFTKLKH